jgi:hypothetical protein
VSAGARQWPASRWRVFAIFMLLFVGLPQIFGFVSAPSAAWLWQAPTVLALGGLTAYAFGRHAVPRLFWRVFAPLFSLYTMAGGGRMLGQFLAADGARPVPGHYGLAVVTSLPVLFFTCIALLRFAGWLSSPAARKSEPLAEVFA